MVVEMEAARSKAAAPRDGGPEGGAGKAPVRSERGLLRRRRAAAVWKARAVAEIRAAAVAGETLAPAVGASSVEWAGAVCAGIDESDGAVEDER